MNRLRASVGLGCAGLPVGLFLVASRIFTPVAAANTYPVCWVLGGSIVLERFQVLDEAGAVIGELPPDTRVGGVTWTMEAEADAGRVGFEVLADHYFIIFDSVETSLCSPGGAP